MRRLADDGHVGEVIEDLEEADSAVEMNGAMRPRRAREPRLNRPCRSPGMASAYDPLARCFGELAISPGPACHHHSAVSRHTNRCVKTKNRLHDGQTQAVAARRTF